jgi:NitT/TauT family transport system substrate-binding protein
MVDRPTALPSRVDRRQALFAFAGLALGCGDRGEGAGSSGARTIRVGMLRISPHLMAPKFYSRFLPPGLRVETYSFNNSTEVKTAIITGSIDFAVTGITAALQGASRDEPFRVLAAAADGASAIVAHERSGITSLTELAGKRVGYVPGSAQDVLLRLSLREQGLDVAKDLQLLKVGFGDMPNALERGDIDAFSGAETGPSVALLRRRSRVVTYPYATKMGKINIVFGTSQTLIEREPELCQTLVETHVRATEHMKKNQTEWARATIRAWGAKLEAVELAIRNISLRWQVDGSYIEQTKVLGEQLLSLKQIKKAPNYSAFFQPRFLEKIGETA